MKQINADTEELIDLIYQIPLEKNGWFNFSKKLLHILQASYIHIQAIDFGYQVLSFSNGVGQLPLETYAHAELDYLRYPTEDDPRWAQFLNPERQGWYQCHTHVSEDFVQQSNLYQKILLPFGLRFVASHELIRDEKLCVFWSVSTSVERRPLTCHELDFLDLLLPHLRRVVMAQQHLYEFSIDNIVGYHLIDRLAQPVILLNLSGQVMHYNHAAKTFLEQHPHIKITQDKLIFPAPYQAQFEERLYQLEDIVRYREESLKTFKEMSFSFSDSTLEKTQRIISISLLASEKEMSFFGVRPLLMLVVEPLAISLTTSSVDIQKYHLCHHALKIKYKLSKREIEICDLFVNGMKLEKIAQTMQLTRSSVRTYLKNIFTKVQCNSQVELMQKLMNMRE